MGLAVIHRPRPKASRKIAHRRAKYQIGDQVFVIVEGTIIGTTIVAIEYDKRGRGKRFLCSFLTRPWSQVWPRASELYTSFEAARAKLR